MARSTFILIISIYGFLLGIFMLLAPSFTLSYFGRDPGDIYQVSWLGFFGALHIAFNYVGISLRKSGNSTIIKAYLTSVTFLLFVSAGLALYGTNVRGIPQHATFFFDIGLWIVLGVGGLYFLIREKA